MTLTIITISATMCYVTCNVTTPPARQPSRRASSFTGRRSVQDDLTLADVDEALSHAQSVPEDERGLAWQRYVDSLLDKRVKLTDTRPAFSH